MSIDLVGSDGWRFRQTFRCTCGVECTEWRSDRLCAIAVQHGPGEAIFVIDDREIIEEWMRPNMPSRWARWVTAVHEYEGAQCAGRS